MTQPCAGSSIIYTATENDGVASGHCQRSPNWGASNLPGVVVPDEVVGRLQEAADPVGEGVRRVIEEAGLLPRPEPKVPPGPAD